MIACKRTWPQLIKLRKLHDRSVNEELHMPSIRQPPPGPIHVHGAVQNSKHNGMCLPLPIHQSTPASVSSILPQSSSDLDMDQGDIIDETIKQIAQRVNQTLFKTSTGDPISSLTKMPPHNNVTNKQTIHDSNPWHSFTNKYTANPYSLTSLT